MSTFNVELKKVVDDSYDISIGYDLSDELIKDLNAGLIGNIKKIAIITDSNVQKLYANKLNDKLISAGYSVNTFVFPAGEKSKTRETKAWIEDKMLANGYRRDCCIIAVGGGVTSDLAGFVAGTYARGVPFINYATSLLAAADASVGGKTAVDTPLATNLIGLFNQPKKVYIDIAAWETLPKREISCGLSETIKHACLADYDFFTYIESHIGELLSIEKAACEHIADNNCRIKYNVVMRDERESGLREVLNLGHTVGRAIETLSDYRLLHGEALSIGMVAEVNLSHKLGYMTADERDRVIALYKAANLPVEIPDYINREALVKKLYTDKKVRDGKLRFVLQKGIGAIVEFSDGVYATPIEESLAREIIMEMP
jgi:3-dehydroquinate synthase